ncbi:GTA-gp10 family protein [Flavobacterium sp.]|jgi:hypothetical protein|uniref:GTA-gp10 family protein n=1 Tax=Flavobacterium sp. TaxID=239 RepID=UPI0037BE9A30
MANPARGEVALAVADTEYTLKFSTNAICELEDRLDKGLNLIVANMERLTTVRALLWAGLRAKHPDVTITQAGEIIDRIGMAQATEVIGKALTAAFPPNEADAKNG